MTDANPTQDSITMAQLRNYVNALPSRQKSEPVHFQYDDMDTLRGEIDEFFSYKDVSTFQQNQGYFSRDYDENWLTSTVSDRESYSQYLLGCLDQKTDAKRLHAARQLIYISQGCYSSIADEDEHVHWIKENNILLRRLGALSIYYDALRIACGKLVTDPTMTHEVEIFVTLLYMLIVSQESDGPSYKTFMKDVASLEPSLSVFLYDQVTQRQAKAPQNYPLKKVLLLLWKALRTTLGGSEDFAELKNIARKLLGSQPLASYGLSQKADPLDYVAYQDEMSQKYPAFIPTTTQTDADGSVEGDMPVSASTIASILQHKTGSSLPFKGGSGPNGSNGAGSINGGSSKHGKGYNGGNGIHGGFQPFIFPAASMNSSTPRSILEAEDLFSRNMYISTATLQTYFEKRLFLERRHSTLDIEYLQQQQRQMKIQQQKGGSSRPHSMASFFHGVPSDDDASDGEQDQGDSSTDERFRVTKEERERLQRTEHIYTVPRMAQIQVSLLKTLLVCIKITGSPNNKDGGAMMSSSMGASSNNIASGALESLRLEVDGKGPDNEALTRVNELREHEIMAKAVASILLLQLQHFKIYHVMAFEYVCQLLIDSNCLLLLLKIFGNAENPGNIHTKNEVTEFNFFQSCSLIRMLHDEPDPDRALDSIRREALEDLGDPLPANYVCRRNMFTIIHLLRVLQKLTKRKTHRILLLVQYKSSAILKRLLKTNQPDLQRYVYKTLKSQVSFLGRKWRSSHMKVITGIYLHCKSHLRDDWISGGADVERDLEDALPAEQHLRQLIRHYHDRVHPNALVPDTGMLTKGGLGAGSTNRRYDWQEMYDAHASLPGVIMPSVATTAGSSAQPRAEGAEDASNKSSTTGAVEGDTQGEGSNSSHTSMSGNNKNNNKNSSSSSIGGGSDNTNLMMMLSMGRDLSLSNIELEPGFEDNYEDWLEAEVFSDGASTVSSLNDWHDSLEDLTTSLQDTSLVDPTFQPSPYLGPLDPYRGDTISMTGGAGVPGWATPAVMPSDDEDEYPWQSPADEHAPTTSGGAHAWATDPAWWSQSHYTSFADYVERQYAGGGSMAVAQGAVHSDDPYDGDDMMGGVADDENQDTVGPSQFHLGSQSNSNNVIDVDAGIPKSLILDHQQRARQSKLQWRVRKSAEGTEWIEDEDENQSTLRQGYGVAVHEYGHGQQHQQQQQQQHQQQLLWHDSRHGAADSDKSRRPPAHHARHIAQTGSSEHPIEQ
ncbi:Factor arrest protein 11 [Actinomortierella ambigua]|uniref:Factor arrest protein 11 n=1 Tax=Actinomortierella ambigua TaxID=1343610 RepID=A0A9P6U7N2_9FUNG|nr:Factor arrest protein 11 [Actinomortierella ambigua]